MPYPNIDELTASVQRYVGKDDPEIKAVVRQVVSATVGALGLGVDAKGEVYDPRGVVGGGRPLQQRWQAPRAARASRGGRR